MEHLETIGQWITILAGLATIIYYVKKRDKEHARSAGEIAVFRATVVRDIGDLEKRLDRHSREDSKIDGKLDNIAIELKEISERVLKIETILEHEKGVN